MNTFPSFILIFVLVKANIYGQKDISPLNYLRTICTLNVQKKVVKYNHLTRQELQILVPLRSFGFVGILNPQVVAPLEAYRGVGFGGGENRWGAKKFNLGAKEIFAHGKM